MGCGASKDPKKGRELNFSLKKVDQEGLDLFYDRISPVIKRAEEIREPTEDARDQAIKACGTHWLQSAHLNEAIKVLLWSISATNNGQIAQAGVSIQTSPPYILYDKAKLTPEQIALADPLVRYLVSVPGSANLIKQLETELEGYENEFKDLLKAESVKHQEEVKRIAEENKKTGKTDYAAMAKEAKWGALNVYNGKSLHDAVTKMKALAPIAQQQEDEFNALLQQAQEGFKEADAIGKKAADEKIFKPREIFDKFHPGERREKKIVEQEWGKDPVPKK